MVFLQIFENDFSVVEPVYAAHDYIRDKSVMQMLASDMFEYMNTAYMYEGGFQTFCDEQDFVRRSLVWFVTYDGKVPTDYSEFDINKVYSVSVFRKKFGLKLVGLGINRFKNIEDIEQRALLRHRAKSAVIRQLKFALNHGWAEVSGRLETQIVEEFGYKYIIFPDELFDNHVFEDALELEEDVDGLHYRRKMSRNNPQIIKKIAFGALKV